MKSGESRHGNGVGCLLGLALVLAAGCGTGGSVAEQQKAFTETLKAQQEAQATLDKREKEVRDREKTIDDRMKEIASKEAALRDQETKQQDTL
jgi:uncharacterized protein HemX